MKTLLAILISVAGLNAYAGFHVTNNSTEHLAALCEPSGKICNGIAPGGHDCSCADDDDYVYFGRVGLSSSTSTADLDAVNVHTEYFQTYGTTGYYSMGDGKVWEVKTAPGFKDTTSFVVEGDPSYTTMLRF